MSAMLGLRSLARTQIKAIGKKRIPNTRHKPKSVKFFFSAMSTMILDKSQYPKQRNTKDTKKPPKSKKFE